MKVFISWSGKRSKALATALRDWLPMVLQYVEPWVSDKDISAGERWAQAIAGELEASNFGIICITPENLHSEWILFESGALSKSMLDAKVIPLLFGLELSDLSGPLSQFQAQKMEQAGVVEVVRSINKISQTKTSEQIVNQLVPALWPHLQTAIESIPDSVPSDKHMRPHHEILEELVTGVRGINSRMRELEPESMDREQAYRRRRLTRIYPRMLEEMGMIAMEEGGGPLQLLMLAGIYREDFPWMAEVLTEAYREIRDGSPDIAERTLLRLRRMMKHMMHSKMFFELSGGSKHFMAMAEELPMILEMAIPRMMSEKSQNNEKDE
ncbi:toll/interleukin-1 receptor domain-containing protein [Burkholderia sp. WAC0059]|uniref:toll/interleukin-1 receptor domain-containing protein n=1 Tax=Burkholderia sp. WAC0059 TaxID=2066022 RepID=UPI000C7EED5E|nr:toll/interleukin-1 receptor domain-containing protein [Burkholderia sp. WAC0059]PLZ00060.1 toll/interleukin-1 receptor domain-containing protein [Burkholderia sp. WAC0059]